MINQESNFSLECLTKTGMGSKYGRVCNSRDIGPYFGPGTPSPRILSRISPGPTAALRGKRTRPAAISKRGRRVAEPFEKKDPAAVPEGGAFRNANAVGRFSCPEIKPLPRPRALGIIRKGACGNRERIGPKKGGNSENGTAGERPKRPLGGATRGRGRPKKSPDYSRYCSPARNHPTPANPRGVREGEKGGGNPEERRETVYFRVSFTRPITFSGSKGLLRYPTASRTERWREGMPLITITGVSFRSGSCLNFR